MALGPFRPLLRREKNLWNDLEQEEEEEKPFSVVASKKTFSLIEHDR